MEKGTKFVIIVGDGTFDEVSARQSGHYVKNGYELIEGLLNS